MSENIISHDLVLYSSQYSVLICQECHFAIQPSAISSHLLRHKVYRNERQALLNSIAKLRLLEPEDVAIPPPTSQPIPGLPVLQGYRCTLEDCGHLCASLKRMRQHWSEHHESREERDKQTYVEDVKMQTFFRGTKLRYFEVQSATERGTTSGNTGQEMNHDNIAGNQNQQQSTQDVEMTSNTPHSYSTSEGASSVSGHPLVDLETLNYFHHFNTRTKQTLPLPEDESLSASAWQDRVVTCALKRQWLMCGLLSIAACHIAVTEESFTKKLSHGERAQTFLTEFDTGWEELLEKQLTSETTADPEDEEAQKIGEHINWFLRFVRCIMLNCSSNTDSSTGLFHFSPLRYLIATIRERNTSLVKPNPAGTDNISSDSAALGVHSLSISPTPNTMSSALPIPELIKRLQTLPGRMADAFGKPKPTSIPDVLNTFLAIEMLNKCCTDMLPAPDDLGTVWRNGMTVWLSKVTDHFHGSQIPRHHRGALAVLGHWLVLVKRAEGLGAWFLKGMVERCWREIEEGLSVESLASQGLVKGLIDEFVEEFSAILGKG